MKKYPPKENKTKIKFQYLLNEVQDHEDKESALKLCQMILNGELKITPKRQDKLLFLLHSKYEGVCEKCQKLYSYGDPIFCFAQKGWHLNCASEEDKSQSFYQTCQKKGLLDI